jgi:hypothetical protein
MYCSSASMLFMKLNSYKLKIVTLSNNPEKNLSNSFKSSIQSVNFEFCSSSVTNCIIKSPLSLHRVLRQVIHFVLVLDIAGFVLAKWRQLNIHLDNFHFPTDPLFNSRVEEVLSTIVFVEELCSRNLFSGSI